MLSAVTGELFLLLLFDETMKLVFAVGQLLHSWMQGEFQLWFPAAAPENPSGGAHGRPWTVTEQAIIPAGTSGDIWTTGVVQAWKMTSKPNEKMGPFNWIWAFL